MSIQLPNNPVNGQQYVGSNGVTYTFDGTKWVGAGGGSSNYTVGPTAPPSPITGQQWFNTSTSPGVLTLFGTDSAWHSVTSGGGGGAVIPVASFTRSPISGTAPLSVTFTDTSSNSPTSWAWSFGDGATSTAQNPVHSYAAAGTYTVTHSASNASGTSAVVSQTGSVTVTTASVGAPVASFTRTPVSGNAPLSVTFTDTSTNSPTGWTWNFGDGVTSTLQNPVHSYGFAGTYTVTHSASNASGTSAVVSQTGSVTVTTAGSGSEVVTLSSPTGIVNGAGPNLMITGGGAYDNFSWTLVKPVGSNAITSGTDVLDGSGNKTWTNISSNMAGNYIYTFTFASNNHTVVAPTITLTAAAGEVVTFSGTNFVQPAGATPGHIPRGDAFTIDLTMGVPNTNVTWSIVAPAGSTQGLSATVALNGSGAITFPDLYFDTQGAYTFTFNFAGSGNTRTIVVNSDAGTSEALAFSGTTFVQPTLTTLAHVPRGDNFVINLSGGTPNTGATWSLTAPAGSTQAVASSPLTLNGSGAATFPNLYFDTVGAYVLSITFTSTGHTRSMAVDVTTGTSEILGFSGTTFVQPTLLAPAHVPRGDNFVINLSGGTPNTGATWSLTAPAGSTQAVASSPLTLNGSGAATFPNLYFDTVGAYVLSITFTSTGHIRTFVTDVTTGTNEVVTVTDTSFPVGIGGPGADINITGGVPNSGLSWTLVKPAGSGASTSGTGIVLDGAGNFTFPGIHGDVVGDYIYTMIFAATGHVRVVPTITLT